MSNSRLKKILFIIFIIALSLRLIAVFTQEESKRVPGADAKDFDNIAVNIISGHGFSRVVEGEKIPTSFRPPVFPWFLAIVYTFFGHNYIAVKIVQAVLGSLTCILIFFIATTIYDKKTALIASIIMAVYKPFISGFNYYGGPAILYSEYFYIFILGLTILMVLRFIKEQNKVYAVMAGIFMGLAVLTRFEFILYPIFLFPYLFLMSHFSIKKFIRKYLLMYLFIGLTLMPWVTRNYIVHGRTVLLSTLGGYIFWMGNNYLANGSSSGTYTENYLELMKETESMNEYERDRIFFKDGIRELKTNPKRIPKLFIKKILILWAPFENGFGMFNPYYAVILLFGSIGILFFRKSVITEHILLILFLIITAVAVVTFGDPRYRYPYESCLIIFAALAMNEIFNLIANRIKTRC